MFLCVRQYARELYCCCVVDNIIIIYTKKFVDVGEGGKFTFYAEQCSEREKGDGGDRENL
jgi:hypothetical protein